MACERSHRNFWVGGPSCSKDQHLFRRFLGLLAGGRGQMVLMLKDTIQSAVNNWENCMV